MATRLQQILKSKGTHEVGNLNSLKIKTLAHGAKVVGADVDNFTLVELGFDAEGQRTCKQLSNIATKPYLIASPEARFMNYEEFVDFYNAVDELARVVILEEGYTRFDTSAFSLNTGVTAIAHGQVAHFDPATKKFIVSKADAAHADYDGSYAKFLVVNEESNLEYCLGKPMVRLEVLSMGL